jgi:hypothetical protein
MGIPLQHRYIVTTTHQRLSSKLLVLINELSLVYSLLLMLTLFPAVFINEHVRRFRDGVFYRLRAKNIESVLKKVYAELLKTR